jgi:hypothetical protein
MTSTADRWCSAATAARLQLKCCVDTLEAYLQYTTSPVATNVNLLPSGSQTQAPWPAPQARCGPCVTPLMYTGKRRRSHSVTDDWLCEVRVQTCCAVIQGMQECSTRWPCYVAGWIISYRIKRLLLVNRSVRNSISTLRLLKAEPCPLER